MSIRITGGTHKGRRLRSVKGPGLRPTTERVRAAIFSVLGDEAVDGARIMDLYAGTGGLGIEALSRGAASAVFVEANARRAEQLRDNLRELALEERAHVYHGRVERVLGRLPGPYDLALIGAPYDLDSWDSLMEGLGVGNLIGEGSVVVAEYRYGTALKERYGPLMVWTIRRYGDTGVSMYRFGGTHG